MSPSTASHDSLPYIDGDPTPQTRAQIASLISADLPPTHTTTPHPSLAPLPAPRFSPLILAELARIASNQPLAAIDPSRYEAPSPPPTPASPPHDHDRARARALHLEAWQQTLQRAAASGTYLGLRNENLALLERFGRTAWLVANAQLEGVLAGVEGEVGVVGEEAEGVGRERRGRQEGVRAEVEGLEGAWRAGVGRVVEVEVAGEGVWREGLGRRRGEGGGGGGGGEGGKVEMGS